MLRDPTVITIVVEPRDRFVRFGAEEVEAALAAQGGRQVGVDPSEVDEDLVRDVSELLSGLGARHDGRRAAAHRGAGRWPRSRTMARRGAPRGFPIGARSDGVPRPASWGAPVRPGPPGHAAGKREAREGNPVRGAAWDDRLPSSNSSRRVPLPRPRGSREVRPEYGSAFRRGDGAYAGIRTRDLFLTKEVLCRLSYVGPILNSFGALPSSSPLSSALPGDEGLALAAS